MEIIIQPDIELAGDLIAQEIVRLFNEKPTAVLGLATGSTPLPTYRALRRRFEAGEVSFSQGTAFILDEYVGLPEGHPESYRTVIRTELTDYLDFPPEGLHVPDVYAEDVHAAAAAYEQEIKDSGGVDLQLLGIGENGHIGFNEPGASLVSRTRVEDLTPSTRRANARFFGGDYDAVPPRCVTQGLGTIMEARHLVLIATGPRKARAVAQLVEGAVSSRWPATSLQFHPHATLLVDEAAAAVLELGDYYRESYGEIPSWRSI
ncbi:MAG TPA: glucosamine-6-phosphate deaminase [Actinomycetaceae bacterium]|nr:glucosamine-6-phosphate deaminase [Actinomycetaceae bacterium]